MFEMNGYKVSPAHDSEGVVDEKTKQRSAGPRLRRWILFIGLTVLLHIWVSNIDLGRMCKRVGRKLSTHNVFRVPKPSASKKVALEAHIMSKCPDAKDCLLDLIVPVMANVSDKVDFAISYIGQISEDEEAVECMHGPEECLGNIIELCAANLYPDAKIYLGFTACLTEDYSSIPQEDLVKGCALEHGLDFDKLNKCASKDDGAFGMDLLRNSVARTSNANVTKSCTVRLNEEIRCIRDGREWKSCDGGHKVEDLIRDIEDAYNGESI